MKKENDNNEEINPSEITRKQAIKKMGKYGALISLGTFIILNPKQAQASSAAPVGDDTGDDTPPPPPGFGD